MESVTSSSKSTPTGGALSISKSLMSDALPFSENHQHEQQQQQPQQQQQHSSNMTTEGMASTLPVKSLLIQTDNGEYQIMQENGQRSYGPPPSWTGPAPARGCEIFVGKIPRDCFENELIPLFESIGPIYKFRLMMDINGANRGFGFCIYTNKEHSKLAVERLNNYEIRSGKLLGVCQSLDNCRLFVGGIPKTKTKEEILTEMSKVTDSVRKVIVYPSASDKSKNRGFAFVEYESHKSAAMARRKLIPGRIQLWGHQIAVDWAEPEREVDETVMRKVKVLYVRNLMLSTPEETLKFLFNRAAGWLEEGGSAEEEPVERVKKMRDYAFVHFRTREQAEMALCNMQETEIDNSQIEVTWAKPVDKSEGNVRFTRGSNAKNISFPVVSQQSGYVDWVLYTQGASPVSTLSPNSSINRSPSNRQRTFRNASGARRTVSHVEMLDEICRVNGWGTPLIVAVSREAADRSILYLGQVTLPGMNQNFFSQEVYRTPEEARQGVAKHVLALFQMQQQLMESRYQLWSMISRLQINNTSNAYYGAATPQFNC